jgi:hypothetical protein
MELSRNLMLLMNIVIGSPSSFKLNFKISQIEIGIYTFKTSDPRFLLLSKRKSYFKQQISFPPDSFPSNCQIITQVLPICDAEASFFPDNGEAESHFSTVVDNLSTDDSTKYSNRHSLYTEYPEQCGEIILAAAQEPMFSCTDWHIPALFTLITRNYFSRFFIEDYPFKIRHLDNISFANKISKLLKLSPVGFGIAGKFIPNHLKVIQLDPFPANHKYTVSIELFKTKLNSTHNRSSTPPRNPL